MQKRSERQDHITRCYDAVAGEYAARLFDELDHKPLDRLMLRYFHQETAGHGLVCDLGCGPGEIAVFLHGLGAQVIGIDISPGMIAEARQRSPHLPFQVGDMFSLDVPARHFAGIAAFYAVVNFTLEDLPALFAEINRVLKEDGLLLLAFHVSYLDASQPNGSSSPSEHQVTAENFFDQDVDLDFTFFDPDAVLQILQEQGFLPREVLVRYPYPERVESQTKRAYMLLQKKGLKARRQDG